MAGPQPRRAFGAETVKKENPYRMEGSNRGNRVTVLYRLIELPDGQ